MARRPGFTLVELLVAMLLVQVALLAVLATSAVIVRAVGDNEARWRAVQRASDRLERLAAGPCTASAASVQYVDGAQETWRVDVANGVRDLRDSISFGRTDPRSVVLESRAAC